MANKTKKTSWHDLDEKELDTKYQGFKEDLRDIRFKILTSTVPNVKRIKQLKRDIARILTVKRSKGLIS